MMLPDLAFPSLDDPDKHIKNKGMKVGLDMGEFERLTEVSEHKIKNGEIIGIQEFNKLPADPSTKEKITAYLRKVINENNINRLE